MYLAPRASFYFFTNLLVDTWMVACKPSPSTFSLIHSMTAFSVAPFLLYKIEDQGHHFYTIFKSFCSLHSRALHIKIIF